MCMRCIVDLWRFNANASMPLAFPCALRSQNCCCHMHHSGRALSQLLFCGKRREETKNRIPNPFVTFLPIQMFVSWVFVCALRWSRTIFFERSHVWFWRRTCIFSAIVWNLIISTLSTEAVTSFTFELSYFCDLSVAWPVAKSLQRQTEGLIALPCIRAAKLGVARTSSKARARFPWD